MLWHVALAQYPTEHATAHSSGLVTTLRGGMFCACM